jgi:hypothetical protein
MNINEEQRKQLLKLLIKWTKSPMSRNGMTLQVVSHIFGFPKYVINAEN